MLINQLFFGVNRQVTWREFMIAPNVVTLIRLFVAMPLLIVCRSVGVDKWSTFVLFVIAALTDMLDGIMARRIGRTEIGAHLDQASDKMFFPIVIGMALFGPNHVTLKMPSWPTVFFCLFVLMVAIDAALFASRILLKREAKWYTRFCDTVSNAAKNPGKAKTWSQAIASGGFLLGYDWTIVLGEMAFVAAIPLGIWSFVARHKWPD